MHHSSLAAFLNDQLSADALWREIEAEVADCRAACAKGGSGHVIITDGLEIEVTRQHVGVLLKALADAELPLSAASYVADALIMSDDFSWDDDAVAVALFSLLGESRALTLADVEDERARLSKAA
jgi:hypothetical protein